MTDERQTDEVERVSRLSSPTDDTAQNNDDRSSDDVVREYEERYGGKRKVDEVDPMDDPGDGPEFVKRPQSAGRAPRSYSTLRVTDEERLWAALAHGSAWLTVVGGVVSVGFIVPITVFVPLIIYFMFRRKSDFVAFHALQAFVLQLVGTVGALVILVTGGVAWLIGMVVALLAMFVLIGFILVPVWGLVGVVLLAVVALMPLAMLLYSTLAAIETYNGSDYRYPFIARWVDRQLAGGLLNVL
ncbi:MAG: DUF4870 domain-containing protein [Chloroflexi bacterium]|nr:DUF4870 domain-containing protein [Chloroflexota bacterium]